MSKIKLLALSLIVIMAAGCAHVSVTETNFDGRTNGLNPYGSGDLEVVRVSITGTSKDLVERAIEYYGGIVYGYDQEAEEDLPQPEDSDTSQ